jgi:hypothetical protein
MDETFFVIAAGLLACFQSTGRWVLGSWKSNTFGEVIVGVMIWLLALTLFVAVFAQVV